MGRAMAHQNNNIRERSSSRESYKIPSYRNSSRHDNSSNTSRRNNSRDTSRISVASSNRSRESNKKRYLNANYI